MNKKTCLVIYLSEYKCLSSSCKRTLGMLKGIVEKGYEVDFLTVETDGKQLKEAAYSFMDCVNVIPLWKECANSVSVAQTGGIKGRILRRIAKWYHLFFIFGHTYKYAKNVKIGILPRNHYDVFVSVSDPKTSHTALNALIKQGLEADRIVEYWGDPLYGDVSFVSAYPNWVIKNIEYKYLKLAHRIVYTSPFTLKAEQTIYPKLAGRMVSVPTANLEEKIYDPFTRSSIKVGYYGDYYTQYRDIRPLYNAFSSGAFDNMPVELIIVGDSDIKLESKDNITILSRRNIEQLQTETDILICLLNSHGTQIPGKLYYNAGTNLPIVVILDGEYKNEIKEYMDGFERFECCENTVESIKEVIKNIVNSKTQYEPSPVLTPLRTASVIID